jgi:hypothetical protein
MSENDTHRGKHVQDDRADAPGEGADFAAGEDGISALAPDVSHPFDQTNGIVDGLEGNADDPETMDEKLDQRADGPDGRVAGIPIAGNSGGQPGVAPPPVIDDQPDGEESEGRNTDTDEPQGP